MPGISRDKDLASTGHGCSPVAPCIASASSVFVNGIRVARRGDSLKPHFIENPDDPPPICVPHNAKINSGSPTVFAQGIPVARRGDSADSGAMRGASRDVSAG
jgi:uncharacterized Zn-binding protein involved in type VI secretion|tara:strand:- start:377 stop:685 length:309 start_codon:yes stop_codon:yes gene_type:complete